MKVVNSLFTSNWMSITFLSANFKYLFTPAVKMGKFQEMYSFIEIRASTLVTFTFLKQPIKRLWRTLLGTQSMGYSFLRKAQGPWLTKWLVAITMETCTGYQEILRLAADLFFLFPLVIKCPLCPKSPFLSCDPMSGGNTVMSGPTLI